MDKSNENQNTQKPKRTLCKGLWIGGAIAFSVVLTKKEWREKLLSELHDMKDGTVSAAQFIRDNREQVVDQIKSTMTEVSTVVREISDDVKVLGQTASHLKGSTAEIVKATKEAAEDIKSLKGESERPE